MRKILLVKTDHKKLPAEDGVPDSLYSIDKLSHGLLTHAVYRGLIKDFSKDILCLRPENGPLDAILLCSEFKSAELSRATKSFPKLKESYFTGTFSNSEIQNATKIFPNLKKWEELEV